MSRTRSRRQNRVLFSVSPQFSWNSCLLDGEKKQEESSTIPSPVLCLPGEEGISNLSLVNKTAWWVYVYMCVCAHVCTVLCTCGWMYSCICVYSNVPPSVHTYVHAWCMHLCICAHVCLCMDKHVQVCAGVCAALDMSVCSYTHVCVHMDVYLCIFVQTWIYGHCVHLHACVLFCTCMVYVHVNMCAYVSVCLHTCVSTFVYLYMFACALLCVSAWISVLLCMFFLAQVDLWCLWLCAHVWMCKHGLIFFMHVQFMCAHVYDHACVCMDSCVYSDVFLCTYVYLYLGYLYICTFVSLCVFCMCTYMYLCVFFVKY